MPKSKRQVLLELDGRTLEGGGQLIRIALCLSALTASPIQIDNIRGNRSGGSGLQPQHLACVQWLGKACNAQLSGVGKGSKTLTFVPGELAAEVSPVFAKKSLGEDGQFYECQLDIGTAGSTGLALQAILPFILFTRLPTESRIYLRVSGGTNVSGSPSYEYIKYVLLPTLARIGFPNIEVNLAKRGWSQGGTSIGSFTLTIPPRPSSILPAFVYRPKDLQAKPAQPDRLRAVFLAPASCHEHFRKVLLPAISHHFGDSMLSEVGSGAGQKLTLECENSQHDKRMYFILIATVPAKDGTGSYTLGRDWLYERKISSHQRATTEMVERVTNGLANEWASGAWIDEHMRDQLVIFQALARGRSHVFSGVDEDGREQLREPSLHARTAEWVAKQVLRTTFDAEGTCEGLGYGSEEDATVDGLEEGLRQVDLG
ncbi:Putative RNA 3'-terminal phosphate cyclase [Septoria linicola]|uniref:RNA 3'-terminal phosphate cyclase n=1 Tax=Septoria linicola TaxID=215465 RepID=A0A9Q9AMI0_9PEZI|nr:putative RNA 3'-terminal phosphate cyclase [Septoria linicola]USW52192.1 Putative RNA 3'-terminal phosphate cyclase [Septoria linicola]